MKFPKTVLLAAGYLFLMTGGLWICQGTGLLHYPRQSLMIDQMSWAYRGGVLVVLGVILLFGSSKIIQK